MRIERVTIHGLRALRAREDRLVNEQGAIRGAVCLRGLNGSGKTTYLDAIAHLWQWFRRCTQKRGFAKPEERSVLLEARLVAALFTELPGPRERMWIAWGDPQSIAALGSGPENPCSVKDGRVTWSEDVLAFWDTAFARAEAGIEAAQAPPNVVWIEAENKYVPEIRRDELTNPRPAPSFVPVARYLPKSRGLSHLEGLLRTLFLARRERWDLVVRYLGELRPGLTLLDRFDEATQRPLFRLATGETLRIDHLSAGERSVLINLCMILRWLSPGGIVLLDEPELHLHVSLMRSSLSVIEALIAEELHGQLLVASHAPEVWGYFRPRGGMIDLGEEPA